jgi:hypothetical protein
LKINYRRYAAVRNNPGSIIIYGTTSSGDYFFHPASVEVHSFQCSDPEWKSCHFISAAEQWEQVKRTNFLNFFSTV